MLALATPAAAAPPEKPGCTFERGETTCVTTTTETGTVGPITATGSTGDGSPQSDVCMLLSSIPFPFYLLRDVVLATETTTTTTTVHLGAPSSNGHELSSGTDTDTVVTGVVSSDLLACSQEPNDSASD
jgi:hypothetical protein